MTGERQPHDQAEFAGGAFHPDLENGRASGSLRVNAGGVEFHSDKGRVELPMDGLQIALGGASDRLVFFTHPSQPKTTLHTADHSILQHPLFADRPELASQIGRVRTKKRTAVAILLSVLGLLIAAVVGLVLSKDLIVRAAANTIPVSWEISLGDKLYEQVSAGKRVISDPVLEEELGKITTPLLAGIGDTRYPLKFHIIEDPTLNAFAMPGGHVVIHSALLLSADAPEEVAGVLAHEIAHVTERHGFRNIISSLGLFAILQTFIGDVSSLTAVILNNSAFLLDRKFSRDFEREADHTGWDYLIAANIEPRGMIEFFRKMQAEEERLTDGTPIEGAEGALTLVSTHPATGERMAALEQKWERLDRSRGFLRFDLNYRDFKDRLRSNLHSESTSERN